MNESSMSSSQERESALFALALEKPPERRSSFLDVMCEDDAALRQRLEALLAAHERPDSLLTGQVEAARRSNSTLFPPFSPRGGETSKTTP